MTGSDSVGIISESNTISADSVETVSGTTLSLWPESVNALPAQKLNTATTAINAIFIMILNLSRYCFPNYTTLQAMKNLCLGVFE